MKGSTHTNAQSPTSDYKITNQAGQGLTTLYTCIQLMTMFLTPQILRGITMTQGRELCCTSAREGALFVTHKRRLCKTRSVSLAGLLSPNITVHFPEQQWATWKVLPSPIFKRYFWRSSFFKNEFFLKVSTLWELLVSEYKHNGAFYFLFEIVN